MFFGLFKMVLALAGLLFTGMGLFVFYQVFIAEKDEPMDRSNRINHLRLLWFVLTRPELFVKSFPWLLKDELENVSKADGTDHGLFSDQKAGNIVLVVDDEDTKELILRTSRYLHDKANVDTDYEVVNHLCHLYLAPHLIEVRKP
ncbi:hypothetical protein Xoosp14_49 [Xanthomonas phage Xoo-sp14]|nr:hypothetical protein Xoosp14_49 [Xanthomonas phage Xoo-sp14]